MVTDLKVTNKYLKNMGPIENQVWIIEKYG